MKSFALRLVLKLRHKRRQEWPSFLLCVVVHGIIVVIAQLSNTALYNNYRSDLLESFVLPPLCTKGSFKSSI